MTVNTLGGALLSLKAFLVVYMYLYVVVFFVSVLNTMWCVGICLPLTSAVTAWDLSPL